MDLVDFVSDAGVSGSVLLGPVGEFVHYTVEDRERLVSLAGKRSRKPLLVNVSHSTFAGAVGLANSAISSGADALLLLPPLFYSYRQPEIEAFFREFAAEVGDAVPLLIDRNPWFTADIELPTIAHLLESGRFAGVCDSSGDFPWFEQLASFCQNGPYILLCGHDSIACSALAIGATALLSDAACAVPELLVNLSPRTNPMLQEFLVAVEQFPYPYGIQLAVEARGQTKVNPAIPKSDETKLAARDFQAWFQDFRKRLQQSL